MNERLETYTLATLGLIKGIGELIAYETGIKRYPTKAKPASVQVFESPSLQEVHDRQTAFHNRIVAMGELACDENGDVAKEGEW